MGNSSSHSVQLAQTRLSFHSGEKQKARKYACAVNRVLPNPIVGQRLRVTDNGSILHNGGTISKKQHGRRESESDFSKVLQKNINTRMAYGHRKSYSDPDVVRLMASSEDFEVEQEANRKSIIAMSPSKAKIKSKKRTHAPEPPRLNTLPKDINKLSSRGGNYTSIFQKKNNIVFMPPVPHLEDYINDSENCNYEKQKWIFDRWKANKSAENYTINKDIQQSVAVEKLCTKNRKPENEVLEKRDIKANELKETTLAAYMKSRNSIKNLNTEDENHKMTEHSINNNLKRYYFDDVECLKVNRERAFIVTKQKHTTRPESIKLSENNTSNKYDFTNPYFVANTELSQTEKLNRNISQKLFSQFKETGNPAENSLTHSLSEEDDIDIKLQLRPTLPKRQLEVAKFSPSEIWKSIVVDLRTQQIYDLSSDEDVQEDRIQRTDKPVAPKRFITDKYECSGVSSGAQNICNKRENNQTLSVPIRQITNLTWVPQHDLADDSDGEETSHKLHNLPQIPMNLQAKFTLPNNMFLGQKCKEQEECNKGIEKNKTQRRKGEKSSDHFSSLRNLKKVLGFRGKSSVDEQLCLDTNWSLSRSLPDFINRLHLTEKTSSKLPAASSEIKRESVFQNSSLSTPSLPAKQEEKEKENSSQYSSQCHVMYLPEYIIADSEKRELKKKTFAYQSTMRKVERKILEEKLAKEIQERENQRRKEKEWMERVEDEFKKQREKEKLFKSSNILDRGESKNYWINKQNEGIRQKNPTGMSKWLRYGRTQPEIRPEPEGGRSSSDERQTELKNRKKQDNRFKQHFVNMDFCNQAGKIEDVSKEECENHTKIKRTGSCQTFQSHSYYMVEKHEESYKDFKQEAMQKLDMPKSVVIFPEQYFRQDARRKPNGSEIHLSKKRSSFEDSESPSEEDYTDNFDRGRRQNSGKRWKEAVIGIKDDSLDKHVNPPTAFLRNHPLRNGARLKVSANTTYQSKGKNKPDQKGQRSNPIENTNSYPSNRYV